MAGRSVGGALRGALQVAAARALGGLPDGELLARFAASCDGAAFAALVERHGPMVLGVCRRILANRHDAEDACQAVFLVLARKAGSLRDGGSLGCWLHGVARRVATSLRRDIALRAARERQATPAAPADLSWHEAQAALDAELARLPERYRAPLVLCYLEGLTRDEAAARLGISPGALHGRLERARQMLRRRLARRGLSPSVLAAPALGASALSPAFSASTAQAATLFATGQPMAANATTLALAREVLMGLSMTKAKLYAGALLLCAALFSALVGGVLPSGSAQDATALAPQKQGRQKTESDEEFIKRISRDLRETDPTPAEVHFFVASTEAKKRQKLIDLFVQERQAKKGGKAEKVADPQALQEAFYKALRQAKDKDAVTKATRAYLDGLLAHAEAGGAAPDVTRQVALLYESLGESAKAEAWRDRAAKEAAKKPPTPGPKTGGLPGGPPAPGGGNGMPPGAGGAPPMGGPPTPPAGGAGNGMMPPGGMGGPPAGVPGGGMPPAGGMGGPPPGNPGVGPARGR